MFDFLKAKKFAFYFVFNKLSYIQYFQKKANKASNQSKDKHTLRTNENMNEIQHFPDPGILVWVPPIDSP